LIASGLALPLKETSRRRDIRPELWPRLTFGHDFLVVMGNGLQFVEVLIRETRPVPSRLPASETAASRQQERQRRQPGRPSIMLQIEAEMRRRAASGELAESLAAEAEALAEWAAAQEHLVDRHVPMPSSIQRQLASVYREMKGEKKPR